MRYVDEQGHDRKVTLASARGGELLKKLKEGSPDLFKHKCLKCGRRYIEEAEMRACFEGHYAPREERVA